MLIASETESIFDRSMLPGGKAADWRGFIGDFGVNSITASLGWSVSGSIYVETASVGASLNMARTFN